jgi:hypothetical protein
MRQGREADHSPPSIAEVKECVELYLHSPSTSSRRAAQLKHRDNFTILYNNGETLETLHVVQQPNKDFENFDTQALRIGK